MHLYDEWEGQHPIGITIYYMNEPTNTSPNGQFGMMVISIDSTTFLAKNFLRQAIPLLAARHKSFLIVIADDLMVYNRYGIEQSAQSLTYLFKEKYWIERKIHIERILALENLEKKVRICRYNDFCDTRFSDLYRKFHRLTLSDTLLDSAVNKKGSSFIHSQKKTTIAKSASEEVKVVNAFLIEETAWAIHMAANIGASDQYYPGDDASLLRHVYSYPNSTQLMTLLGVSPHTHQFWNFKIDEGRLIFDKTSWRMDVAPSGRTGVYDEEETS